ncbi:hypothetical protein V8G54_035319 [Vigna mungo]|uniref:Uncharacterized protein n=1 Tax=Vigna mungo TaxID=3915 RepID=A0AAQ3MEY2_VIGMU
MSTLFHLHITDTEFTIPPLQRFKKCLKFVLLVCKFSIFVPQPLYDSQIVLKCFLQFNVLLVKDIKSILIPNLLFCQFSIIIPQPLYDSQIFLNYFLHFNVLHVKDIKSIRVPN